MENVDNEMSNRTAAMLKEHISTVVSVLVEHEAISLKALRVVLEQRMGRDLAGWKRQIRRIAEQAVQEITITSSMTRGCNLSRLPTHKLAELRNIGVWEPCWTTVRCEDSRGRFLFKRAGDLDFDVRHDGPRGNTCCQLTEFRNMGHAHLQSTCQQVCNVDKYYDSHALCDVQPDVFLGVGTNRTNDTLDVRVMATFADASAKVFHSVSDSLSGRPRLAESPKSTSLVVSCNFDPGGPEESDLGGGLGVRANLRIRLFTSFHEALHGKVLLSGAWCSRACMQRRIALLMGKEGVSTLTGN